MHVVHIFRGIMSVPHNIVMDFNDVMWLRCDHMWEWCENDILVLSSMLNEKDGGGPMKTKFEVGGGLHTSHEING